MCVWMEITMFVIQMVQMCGIWMAYASCTAILLGSRVMMNNAVNSAKAGRRQIAVLALNCIITLNGSSLRGESAAS